MPRIFTKKEREYIAELMYRNTKAFADDYANREEFKKGLTFPMSNNEHQIRYRIRRKTHTALANLLAVENAGIFPDIVRMLDDYGLGLMLAFMGVDERGEDLKSAVVGFVEDQDAYTRMGGWKELKKGTLKG